MAVTKRARVERAVVTAMRVVGDKEGKDDNKKDGGGDEGGVRQRGQGQQQQEQWQRGWRASDGDEDNGNRRQTTINQ